MKTKFVYPPEDPRATATFYVATYKIVLYASGSETPTGLHRLPTLFLTGRGEVEMAAIVVFIPDGLPVPPPSYDASIPLIYLYYRQSAYEAVLDLLVRPGNVECSFHDGGGGPPSARLVGVTVDRPKKQKTRET